MVTPDKQSWIQANKVANIDDKGNPKYSDDQLSQFYEAKFGSEDSSTSSVPTSNNSHKMQWINANREANVDATGKPKYSDDQLSKFYDIKFPIQPQPDLLARSAEVEKKEAKEMSPIEAFEMGVGKTTLGAIRGVKQIGMEVGEKTGLLKPGTTARYTQEVEKQDAPYEDIAEAHPIATRVGETAAFIGIGIPLAVAGAPLVAGAGAAAPFIGSAAISATEAGTQFMPKGQSRTEQAVIGGLAGLAGAGFARGGALAVKFSPFASQELTAPGVAAASQIAERQALVGETGVPVLGSQVTKAAAIATREAKILELGPKTPAAKLLIERMEESVNAANQASEGIIKQLGGTPQDIVKATGDIQNYLIQASKIEKANINNLYTETLNRSNTFNLQPMSADNLLDTYNKVNKDFMRAQLSPDVETILNKIENKPGAFANTMTLREGFDLHKALNANYNRGSAETRSAAATIKNVLDSNLQDFALNKPNAAPLIEQFNAANEARAQFGKVYGIKSMQRLIESNPSAAANKLFKGNRSLEYLNNIKTALLNPEKGETSPSEAGIAKWNVLRNSAVKNLFQKSLDIRPTIEPGTNVAKPVLSYVKLINNIKSMGDDSLKMLIDDPKIYKQTQNLVDILSYYQQKPVSTIALNTAAPKIAQKAEELHNILGIFGKTAKWAKGIVYMLNVLGKYRDKQFVLDNLKIGAAEKVIKLKPPKAPPFGIKKAIVPLGIGGAISTSHHEEEL